MPPRVVERVVRDTARGKVIEVLAHQGFVVARACLALQALRDEIGDVGRTAAACNELEVDHLHLVAVEEQVVGPDVAVQQHVAFGQRGQCRHRSLSETFGEACDVRRNRAGAVVEVDLPARREGGQQEITRDRRVDARKCLQHRGIRRVR